ncbi:MAG: hypothetical protein N3F03_02065 [Ignavibacteria bacterium]|nr:hypothetical protein [Ignavibacteria bacterium]
MKNWILIFVLPIIFSGIILLYINFNGVLKYKNPDYLVEFGLTSLLDLPIYYLWTLPLVASFFLVAIILSEKFSFHRSLFLSILFTLSVLLVKIDLLENKFKLEDLTIFALIFGFVFYQLSVLKKFKSIWIACFSFLVTIYSYVLVFGSKNSFIIKTFFARTYSEWEGLFSIKKINLSTLDLISSVLFVLLAIFFFIFDRRK